MNTDNLQQQMTDEDRAKFDRGAKLLEELQRGKHFDDYWVPIGEGVLAVRRTVMTVLRLKKPAGGYYNNAFGLLVARTPYSHMHKVTRSNLLFCMDHLATVMEMRVGWEPMERVKVAHPDTMAKRLREYIKQRDNPEAAETVRRNVSPMGLLREKYEDALHDNAALTAKLKAIEQRDGSLFDLKRDEAEDIAQAIVANVTEYKANKIHKLLGEAIKRKRSKHAG